jgi:hypothetical protein
MADDKVLPQVKKALRKDGWKLDAKGVAMREDGHQFFIDLRGEKDGQMIAVEVKSFLGNFMQDWHLALGQYLNYKALLAKRAPDHVLYLAVPETTYAEYFASPFIQNMVELYKVNLLIFNPNNTAIEWKRQ